MPRPKGSTNKPKTEKADKPPVKSKTAVKKPEKVKPAAMAKPVKQKKQEVQQKPVGFNTLKYIENFLKIKTKEAKIVPFLLNDPQRRYYAAVKAQYDQKKPVRIIILKARQMGFSTLTEAMIFKQTATHFNVNSMIVTHKDEATTNLFNMSKLFYETCPEPLRPMLKASNAKELIFENPTRDLSEKAKNPGLRSRIKCATAGGEGVGRSDTLINIHVSEYAFWPGDKASTLAGFLQAVPNLPGTMVVIESTANGYEEFKDLWDRAVAGQNDFVPLFFAWWEMRDYRMTYTGFELTKDERELQALYNLDLDQLTWRRWCIENNCSGNIDVFRQEYPSCPDEAFLMSGRPVFDTQKVIARIEQLRQAAPPVRGMFRYDYKTSVEAGETVLRIDDQSICFEKDKNGYVSIYEYPQMRRPYVIGGDTAGEGSDFFVGQVLDNTSGKQVAVLHHQFDEDMYAEQMYCLGIFYNTALLGVEINYSTFPVKRLQQLGYPRMFVRTTEDSITHKMQDKFGFRTDRMTRPVLIAGLVEVFRENTDTINHVETLREALTFAKNEHGRAEAQEGKHDDLLMALGIAHYIRPQQAFVTKAETVEKPKKLIDRLKPRKRVVM